MNYCEMTPLSAILLLTTYVAAYRVHSPIISTSYGEVKGTVKSSRYGREFNSFTGIPYAKPPLGKLRFAAPEQPEPWNQTFDATKDAPLCIQRNYLFTYRPTTEGHEDCLYLNVYVPQVAKYKNAIVKETFLPVMVFIHWGAFIAGSSSPGYIGPEYFMDKEIILVTFNYRLGPFGFFTTLDDEAPGNYGLKDQILALKWIQRNIQRFGGDKDRVTISGQSAGAGSTHLHLLSAASKGLFHQAVSQSGNALAPWAYLNSVGQKQVNTAQAVLVGCGNGTESSKETVACLRAVSAEDIMESQDSFRSFYADPLMVFMPAIETQTERNPDPFLTQAPIQYLLKGEFKKLPWLVGTVKDEGILKVGALVRHKNITDAFNQNFEEVLTGPLLAFALSTANITGLYKNVSDFYFNDRDKIDLNNSNSIQGLIDLYTDRSFYYSLYQSLFLQTTKGHKHIYLYNFEYVGEYSYRDVFSYPNADRVHFDWGTCHCDDLLYLFSSPQLFPKLVQKHDHDLSKKMVNLWTNFVIYGNPNPPQNVALKNLEWPPLKHYDNLLDEIQLLNITGQVGEGFKFDVSRGFHKKRMEFWMHNSIYENSFEYK